MSAAVPTAARDPRLDALRGLALALVVLYHLNLLGVGWVGVQLFFVLSGFLITRQLLALAGRRAAGESLRIFYGRRALRILPPYFLYLAVLLACVPWLPASQQAPVAAQWGWAASFTYNGLGMTRFHQPTWFLDHFWTLAVEEQFYLLWPPLLLVLVPARRLPAVLLGLVLAGPLLRAAVWLLWPMTGLGDPAALPYAVGVCTVSQLDAFALGGLLCFAQAPFRRGSRPLLLLAGALLLAWGAGALVNGAGLAPMAAGGAWLTLGYPNTLPLQHQFLWGYTAINGVAALAVGFAAHGHRRSWLLEQPWLAGLGRLSYTGYLLHFPLAHLCAPAIYRVHLLTGASPLLSTLLFLPVYLCLLLGPCLLIREFHERPLLRLKDRWFPL